MTIRGTQHVAIAVPTERSHYARYRAISLLLVYVLMAIHIAHWKIAGKTLAPLELNEVMYTLELGIVTAGFLFMVAVVIATAIFGRFFCSWGCHILALQDLSAWFLQKLRIKPRAVCSRLLLWVPVIAATYMFIWPQVSRIASGRPMATLHLAEDADGWASFTTENFARNLPGPGVTILTFFICGFVIVYILGTRSFCSYGCPYGAVFGLADRIAPGRIRAGPDCTQCGTCTSVCSSHVRVHEELNRFGMVVNPACMKDFDCVSACPQATLRYGFGRPSLFRRIVGTTQIKRSFDFTLWEEFVAAMVFVAILLIYRGLYDLVPFLLTLALGAIFAYCTLVLIRLVHHRNVTLNRLHLRRAGSMTGWGATFSVGMLLLGIFTIHSAFVQYSVFQGQRMYAQISHVSNTNAAIADRSIAHLARVQSWSLISLDRIERMLGDLLARRLRWAEAETSRRRLLERTPDDAHVRELLAMTLVKQGRFDAARREYVFSLDLDPSRAEPHYGLAGVDFQSGQPDRAERHLRKAMQVRPDHTDARYDLGAVLVERGAVDEGIDHLRECLRLNPQYGDAHYNLAVALATRGALQQASVEIKRVIAIQPEDQQTRRFQAMLMSLLADGNQTDVQERIEWDRKE